jgi:hypothetical protein
MKFSHNVIAVLAAFFAELLTLLQWATGINIIPERYAPWVVMLIATIPKFTSLIAQFYNPDGSPAETAYISEFDSVARRASLAAVAYEKAGGAHAGQAAWLAAANAAMKSGAVMLLACLLLAGSAWAQSMHPMMPDPMLTPGALDPRVTQATIQDTICQSGYTKSVRNVPESVKREVMQRYGLAQ